MKILSFVIVLLGMSPAFAQTLSHRDECLKISQRQEIFFFDFYKMKSAREGLDLLNQTAPPDEQFINSDTRAIENHYRLQSLRYGQWFQAHDCLQYLKTDERDRYQMLMDIAGFNSANH